MSRSNVEPFPSPHPRFHFSHEPGSGFTLWADGERVGVGLSGVDIFRLVKAAGTVLGQAVEGAGLATPRDVSGLLASISVADVTRAVSSISSLARYLEIK
jgi:hypothetical protein